MRSWRPASVTTRALLLLLTMIPLACGGGGGPEETGGTVVGTVYYEGTAEETLYVAAFLEWPTLSAPEMFVKIPSPVYPQDYELKNLDPEDYCIFAFIDLLPESPTLPGEEDIKSTPTEKTHVTETETIVVDITLPST